MITLLLLGLVRCGSSEWAVVTGASSGIGEACAAALASKGWEVWLGCRTIEKADAAAARIAAASESHYKRSEAARLAGHGAHTDCARSHEAIVGHGARRPLLLGVGDDAVVEPVGEHTISPSHW